MSAKLTRSSAERGKNRDGQSFLQALRRLGRWTPQEFEAVVGLWLEQCRNRMFHLSSSSLPADYSTEPQADDVSPFVAGADSLLQRK